MQSSRHIIQQICWVSLGDWLLKLWWCGLLLKAGVMLLPYQAEACWWLCLFFTQNQVLWAGISSMQLCRDYERSYFCWYNWDGWRVNVARYWFVHSCGVIMLTPVANGLLALDWQRGLLLSVAWVIASPGYYLMWILVRILLIHVRSGATLAALLLVPWFVPSTLVILALLSQEKPINALIVALSWTILQLMWLPRCVDETIRQAYISRYASVS